MSKCGWVKIDRELLEHWSWEGKCFSEGQAIVDLHLKASHKARKVRLRCGVVTIKRGQLARSENRLATDWGWSRGKVRRFLSLLETDGVISQQKNNQTTIITLLNYDIKDDSTNSKQGESGTASGIRIRKKEERSIKRKDKKKKQLPKNHSPQSEQPCHLEKPLFGLGLKDWQNMSQYMQSKKIFATGRIRAVVRGFHKARSLGMSIGDCIACMIHHGWRSFKAEWVKACSWYRTRKAQGKATEDAKKEIQRTRAYLDGLDKLKTKSLREWLIEETHYLLFEKKISHEQRAEIVAGRLGISAFTDARPPATCV